MTLKVSHVTNAALVTKFKQSAAAYYSACDAENFKKQKQEVGRTNEIIKSLDSFGPEGRLALVPLLDDADHGIRTVAAAFLLKVIPVRATAVLEDIRKGLTHFPRMDAGRLLESYAKGKWRG